MVFFSCPTFFLLTEYFQKCLLSFLTQHLAELPKQSTQEFLATIQQNIQYFPTNRIQSLFNHFQYNCGLTWNQTFLPNNHFLYVISSQNQKILNDILKSAASTQHYNPFLPSLVSERQQQIPCKSCKLLILISLFISISVHLVIHYFVWVCDTDIAV